MMDDGTTWGRRLHLNVYIVAETIVNQVIHIKKWMNVLWNEECEGNL